MDLWDSTGAKEAEPHVILGKVLNRLGEFGVRYPSIYEGIGSVCLQLIQLWDGCDLKSRTPGAEKIESSTLSFDRR